MNVLFTIPKGLLFLFVLLTFSPSLQSKVVYNVDLIEQLPPVEKKKSKQKKNKRKQRKKRTIKDQKRINNTKQWGFESTGILLIILFTAIVVAGAFLFGFGLSMLPLLLAGIVTMAIGFITLFLFVFIFNKDYSRITITLLLLAVGLYFLILGLLVGITQIWTLGIILLSMVFLIIAIFLIIGVILNGMG